MATQPGRRQRGRPPYPLLTPAEERVLQHLRRGHTNAEIAGRLSVSPDAVKYHVSNMLGKLQLENREQLAAWRQPSGLRRVWAAAPWLGWKVAAAVGVVGVVAVSATMWAANSLAEDEPGELFNGVVTIGYDGQPANGRSYDSQISGNGRYVVFVSEATNLSRDDATPDPDVYRFDRMERKTELVSRPNDGATAGQSMGGISVNHDGSRVAFIAEPPPGAGTGSRVFIRDFPGRGFTMIPAQPDRNVFAPSLSADGRLVAFGYFGPDGAGEIQVFDTATGAISWSLAVHAVQNSTLLQGDLRISPNGRWVAFQAESVPGAECELIERHVQINGVDTLQPLPRPYYHDLQTGETACAPLLAPPNGQASTVGLLGLSGDSIVYPYMTSDLASTAASGARVIDARIAMFSMATGEILALFDSQDLSYCCGGPPAFAADTVAWGPWHAWGLDLFEPKLAQTRFPGAVPAHMSPQGLEYFGPSLSADARHIAYGIRQKDTAPWQDRDDIYVTAR